MQSQINRLEVNGTFLAYVEKGAGVPVVFVHGGFSDYRSWESQIDVFSKQYRAISYSLRYHYPNKWMNEDGSDYTIVQHAQDLAGLIEQLNLAPAHVVGTSYGGRVALHVARDHSQLVRSLVLAEPSLSAWMIETADGKKLVDDLMKQYFEPAQQAIKDGNLELATKLFVTGVAGPGWYDKLSMEIRSRYLDNIRVQAVPGRPASFSQDDARKIKVPVLLLTGRLSTGVFRIVADMLGKVIPNAERGEIPDASHIMSVFNPDGFNHTVNTFLAKHQIGKT